MAGSKKMIGFRVADWTEKTGWMKMKNMIGMRGTVSMNFRNYDYIDDHFLYLYSNRASHPYSLGEMIDLDDSIIRLTRVQAISLHQWEYKFKI